MNTIESIRDKLTIIEAMQMVNKSNGAFYSSKEISSLVEDIRNDVDDYLVNQPDSEPKTYKVGDKVKIKSWDALLKAGRPSVVPAENDPYSVNTNIYFAEDMPFLESMKYLCGSIQVIKEISNDIIYFKGLHDYYFTTDMLE